METKFDLNIDIEFPKDFQKDNIADISNVFLGII